MDAPQAVIALALDHPDGHVIPFHWHSRAQLLYASTGVMTVTTGSGVWVLPPLRAMWIPAFTEHQIRASGHLSMRTLYIKPDAVRDFPPDLPHCLRLCPASGTHRAQHDPVALL